MYSNSDYSYLCTYSYQYLRKFCFPRVRVLPSSKDIGQGSGARAKEDAGGKPSHVEDSDMGLLIHGRPLNICLSNQQCYNYRQQRRENSNLRL